MSVNAIANKFASSVEVAGPNVNAKRVAPTYIVNHVIGVLEYRRPMHPINRQCDSNVEYIDQNI